MKKLLSIFVLALCSLSLFACFDDVKAETNVTGYEGTEALFNDFCATTLEQENFTFKFINDGKVAVTYYADGVKAHEVTGTMELYAYVNGEGKKCVAYPGEDLKQIYVSDYYYNTSTGVLPFYLTLFLQESESGTYSATLVEDMLKGTASIEVIEELVNEEGQNIKFTIKATSVDGLIDRVTVEGSNGDDKISYEFTITYGDATVTLPSFEGYDIIHWEPEDGEE